MTATETKEPTSIEAQEKRFAEMEGNMAIIRAFMAKHAEVLVGVQFSSYAIDLSVNVSTYDKDPLEIRKVAALFGRDGWVRKANSYSCGSIDWYKTVDGVTIKIENAENIKPTLKEEVRL